MNKILILISLAYSCGALADQVAFNCVTPKHNIVITKENGNLFRYRSWNIPKSTSEKPDLELKKKNASEIEGTGVCRHTRYLFTSGKTTIEVTDSTDCMEGEPPKNAIGNLFVFIDDEMKNHYYCLKQ